MSEDASNRAREAVDAIYRTESRQVPATLIRLLGDFDAAEEALHEAFVVAVEQWSRDGVPANPRAWLVSTGRFKTIDGMRRRDRYDASLDELAKQLESATTSIIKRTLRQLREEPELDSAEQGLRAPESKPERQDVRRRQLTCWHGCRPFVEIQPGYGAIRQVSTQ